MFRRQAAALGITLSAGQPAAPLASCVQPASTTPDASALPRAEHPFAREPGRSGNAENAAV
jgi:hypothetical protein